MDKEYSPISGNAAFYQHSMNLTYGDGNHIKSYRYHDSQNYGLNLQGMLED